MKTKIFIVGLMILAMIGAKADADRDAFHAAKDTCLAETGVTRPEKGARLSKEDRTKIHACLSSKGIKPHGRDHSEVWKARDLCASELGLAKPERGVRRSDEDRQKMKACLQGKGFKRPDRQGISAAK